jgi:hypothetical protein
MKLPSSKKGSILIELLLAMAIFAIAVVTIFTLFISATQGVMIGLEKTKGTLLSTEALEAAYAFSKYDQDYLTPGKYEVGVNDSDQWVLIPKSGLMGHFLMANNAQDSSAYKNRTLLQQVNFFEDRKGQPLAAAVFNGTNSYIKTENTLSLQIGGPLTLAAWVLDAGAGGARKTIAGKYNLSEEEGGYILYKEGNNYYFKIFGQGGTASLSTPSGSSWQHVAGVYDPGDKTLRLYVNGTSTEPVPTNITSINKVPYVEFFIGNDAGISTPWHGRISDVRIYNRALTANEVAGLYGSYSAPYEKSLIVSDLNGLAGTWSFNEGGGCTAHDNSGNNNHGLIIENCSSSQWVKNRNEDEKRAFNFEGDNYIEIADSSTLRIENEISISLWIKMPDPLPEQDMTILHKRAAGSEDYSFSLIYEYDENENIYGYGWAASTDLPNEFNNIELANTAIPNRWQHIVVTFDGASKKIYIDNQNVGVLKEFTVSNSGDNSNLFIGQNAESQNQLLNVAIDDLRIYNKILTTTERQAIFLSETKYYLE